METSTSGRELGARHIQWKAGRAPGPGTARDGASPARAPGSEPRSRPPPLLQGGPRRTTRAARAAADRVPAARLVVLRVARPDAAGGSRLGAARRPLGARRPLRQRDRAPARRGRRDQSELARRPQRRGRARAAPGGSGGRAAAARARRGPARGLPRPDLPREGAGHPRRGVAAGARARAGREARARRRRRGHGGLAARAGDGIVFAGSRPTFPTGSPRPTWSPLPRAGRACRLRCWKRWPPDAAS